MPESPEITDKNALVLPYGPLYICAKFTQKVLWFLLEIAIKHNNVSPAPFGMLFVALHFAHPTIAISIKTKYIYRSCK